MADADDDGELDPAEWAVAMHLARQADSCLVRAGSGTLHMHTVFSKDALLAKIRYIGISCLNW